MLRSIVNYANNSAWKCQWSRTMVDPSTCNGVRPGQVSSERRAAAEKGERDREGREAEKRR